MISLAGDDILLPAAMETLELLKQKKLKIAIGSSSKNAPKILEKTKIETYIDACVCGLDIVFSKPNPEVFLKAGDRIGIDSRHCLVVEDSAVGIEAAENAGMKTLAVGCDYMKLDSDYMAADLSAVDNWECILEG